MACLGLILGAGCGDGLRDTDRAAMEGMLLMNNGAEPRDLDPHLVTGFPEHRVIKALIEGLVGEHPTQDGQVVPAVAERWEADASARVWTFHLREAQWSNGDPVTADDFVYAYRRILNPELGASYAGMLYGIVNAQAYNEGRLSDFEAVGVKALDAHTLEVRLTGPTPHLPLMLTHYTWFPLHPPTIEKHGAFAQRGTGWTRAENFVGNGPFSLEEWRPNQRIVVRKRANYWDADAVALNGITFYPVQDRQTENRMFETGQIHLTDGLPFNLRDQYRAAQRPEFREEPLFATSYVGLNTLHEGLTDPRVRQALSMVIDREQIIERVTKNGRAAQAFVPPFIGGYAGDDGVRYDPDAARALLAEAGYPGGVGLPQFEFIIVNADTSRIFAEVLQGMWREELGIEVQLANKEWQVLISEMDSGNFDMFLLSWVGDYLDPATFLKIMRTGDGNNRTGYADPAYDALLDKANQQGTLAARYAVLAEAEARLLAAMPIVPLVWANNLYLADTRVEGWAPKVLMDRPYKAVRLRLQD